MGMTIKCAACGVNDVDIRGDICELCDIVHDPYITEQFNSQMNDNLILISQELPPQLSPSSQSSSATQSSYQPHTSPLPQTPSATPIPVLITDSPLVTPEHSNALPVTPAMSSVSNTPNIQGQPITAGIAMNVNTNVLRRSIISKWARAVIFGEPINAGNDVIAFQVFPDHSGTSLNNLGNLCDQVMYYGELTGGTVSNYNDVEVYGRRSSRGHIIATSIRNVSSGSEISAYNILSITASRLIAALLFAVIIMFLIFIALAGGGAVLRTIGIYVGGTVAIVLLGYIAIASISRYRRMTTGATVCIIIALLLAGYLYFPEFSIWLYSRVGAALIVIFLIRWLIFRR
jgi:hypothetical protein